MTIMKSDTAASDLIAVVALIAVFVTAAAIVGVVLLSTPPGDAPPAMIARMANESGTVTLYHDGGDPLEKGRFEILVEGENRVESFSLIDASGITYGPDEWTTWETGQALVLDDLGREEPHVQIVGEGVSRSGSDWLLHDIGEATPVPAPVLCGGSSVWLVEVSDVSLAAWLLSGTEEDAALEDAAFDAAFDALVSRVRAASCRASGWPGVTSSQLSPSMRIRSSGAVSVVRSTFSLLLTIA